MKFGEIKVIEWYVPKELNHFSYLYTSLIEYSKSGQIKLRLSNKNHSVIGRISVENEVDRTNHSFRKVCFVNCYDADNNKWRLAFDFDDIPYFFSTKALEQCDVVYKRCYQSKFIQRLPENLGRKIKPMGLPFMVRPDKLQSRNKLLVLYVLQGVYDSIKLDRLFFKRSSSALVKRLEEIREFIGTRKFSDFEKYSEGSLNKIFFQKRLMNQRENEDAEKINEERVQLVTLLKRKFPKHFIGGIKKDSYSDSIDTSLHTNFSSQQEFLNEMRNARICIYTRGLSFSTGWTLSEFLSQGKVIVGEQLYNELPHPLMNGKHLVTCDKLKDIPDVCDTLLSDKVKMDKLSREARKYYEAYVSPRNFLKQLWSH